MDYTEKEIAFLLAGLKDLAERDVIWEDPGFQRARDHLIDLGLIVTGTRPNASGSVNRVPLTLSPAGFAEARRLHEEPRQPH